MTYGRLQCSFHRYIQLFRWNSWTFYVYCNIRLFLIQVFKNLFFFHALYIICIYSLLVLVLHIISMTPGTASNTTTKFGPGCIVARLSLPPSSTRWSRKFSCIPISRGNHLSTTSPSYVYKHRFISTGRVEDLKPAWTFSKRSVYLFIYLYNTTPSLMID